jgi:hypothetical protein
MAVRDRGGQAFASGSPTVSSRHVGGGPGLVGGGPGLVDEDERFRIKIKLSLEPFLAAFQDIRAILLGCVRGPFLSVIFLRAKKRDSDEMPNE